MPDRHLIIWTLQPEQSQVLELRGLGSGASLQNCMLLELTLMQNADILHQGKCQAAS